MTNGIKVILKNKILISMFALISIITHNANATFFENTTDTRLTIANLKINELQAELKQIRKTNKNYNKEFEDQIATARQLLETENKMRKEINHLSGKLKAKYFKDSVEMKNCLSGWDLSDGEILKSCLSDFLYDFDEILKPILNKAVALGYVKAYSKSRINIANVKLNKIIKKALDKHNDENK